MSWHPKSSGHFRYRTKHEALHARALMSRNNPSANIGDVVESPMPANQVFLCPNRKKEGKCPLDL